MDNEEIKQAGTVCMTALRDIETLAKSIDSTIREMDTAFSRQRIILMTTSILLWQILKIINIAAENDDMEIFKMVIEASTKVINGYKKGGM